MHSIAAVDSQDCLSRDLVLAFHVPVICVIRFCYRDSAYKIRARLDDIPNVLFSKVEFN